MFSRVKKTIAEYPFQFWILSSIKWRINEVTKQIKHLTKE